jgi:type IV pilus assembly protein PilW
MRHFVASFTETLWSDKAMCSSNLQRRYLGFSLIELMISLALGLLIVLGVTDLYVNSSRTQDDVSRASRQLENSLFALDLLAGELALAGYWGEADYPLVADDLTFGPLRPEEMAGEAVTGYPVPPLPCAGSGKEGRNPRVELGWAMEYPLTSGLGVDLEVAMSSAACDIGISPAKDTEEFFAIRRASTCAAGAPGGDKCAAIGNFFHIQSNGCSDANAGLSGGEVKLYRVTEFNAKSVLNYRGFDCEAEASDRAPIYRYISRIYYVNHRDELVRLELGESNTYTETVLVEGVEALRFEWLIDRNLDGDYDVVRSVGDESWSEAQRAADWQNVVGANMSMIVRSSTPEVGYRDSNIYELPGQIWTIEKDEYQRILRSRTVEFVNVAGRRR